MKEKDVTPQVLKWFAKHYNWDESVALEIKLVKHPAKSMPFNAVQPHQVRSLQMAENMLTYKIPDDSRGQKPFDAVILVEALGIIAVIWYEPRKLKRATLIYVTDYVAYKKKAKKKSMTMAQAEQIAFEVVDL